MAGYILSILGIVVAGIFIDILVPSGNINKYIKSVFGIFVLAVIIAPVVKFVANSKNISVEITGQEVNQNLLYYIFNQRVQTMQKEVQSRLEEKGFSNIDIKINFSIKDNVLSINSCEVNMKKLSISGEAEHINKYEFIRHVVNEITNLTDEVIIFNE